MVLSGHVTCLTAVPKPFILFMNSCIRTRSFIYCCCADPITKSENSLSTWIFCAKIFSWRHVGVIKTCLQSVKNSNQREGKRVQRGSFVRKGAVSINTLIPEIQINATASHMTLLRWQQCLNARTVRSPPTDDINQANKDRILWPFTTE
jgi:hypothetical protein